jgi:hypothetical protein
MLSKKQYDFVIGSNFSINYHAWQIIQTFFRNFWTTAPPLLQKWSPGECIRYLGYTISPWLYGLPSFLGYRADFLCGRQNNKPVQSLQKHVSNRIKYFGNRVKIGKKQRSVITVHPVSMTPHASCMLCHWHRMHNENFEFLREVEFMCKKASAL